MKTVEAEKALQFDPDKCSSMHGEMLDVLQKYKPTVGEIIITLGNLGYSIGASIEGYKEKGPSIEEVQKLYYEDPKKVGVALMVQGLQTASWFESWQELQLK